MIFQSRPWKGLWGRGSLTWRDIAVGLWRRSQQHRLTDRAGLLSFYFLLAFFPLLLTLSSLIGLVLSSQTDTYWRLLDYIFQIMPASAFSLFTATLNQIKTGASGSKLSFGILISFWSASSGIAAIIEALNVAFGVKLSRRWWHRRLVAMGLTLGIAILLTCSLGVLFAGSTLGRLVSNRLPVLHHLSHFSGLESGLVSLLLLTGSLVLTYAFGPNVQRKHWQGILPGTAVALVGGVVSSVILKFYLLHFGSLGKSYGSLGGMIALMFWLYSTAIALLVGGELNAIIFAETQPDRH